MSEQEEKKEKKRRTFNLLELSVVTLIVVLVLMVITAIVIVSTPIKEYLPGFNASPELEREVYVLSRKADSLERELQRKDIYFDNLKKVIEGYDFSQDSLEPFDAYTPLFGYNVDSIELHHSAIDSALRAAYEEEQRISKYGIRYDDVRTK